MVRYTVTYCNSAGTPQGVLVPLTMSIIHKTNVPSLATIVLGESYMNTAFAVNQIVVITRSDPENNINPYTEFIGFIRGFERSYAENRRIILQCFDALVIVSDRIVAWYPNLSGVSLFATAQYPKASGILTNLWNYNVGSSANGAPPVTTASTTRRYGTALNRWTDGRVTNAATATDTNIGATGGDFACSGEPLLQSMQKVADFASLDFDVTMTLSPLSFSFRYANYLGADRTTTVKMTMQNNTIASYKVTTANAQSPTYYMAVGKGKDKNNLRSAYPASAPTGLNLREGVVRGGSSNTVDQLTSMARLKYNQELRKVSFYDIEVVQSSQYRYGRDYYMGDLVMAVFGNSSLTRKIGAVSISSDNTGKEEVKVDLEATI
jgi:hypothetical protein